MAGPIAALASVVLATSLLLTQVGTEPATPKKDYEPLFSAQLFVAQGSLLVEPEREVDSGLIGKKPDPPAPPPVKAVPTVAVVQRVIVTQAVQLPADFPVQAASVRTKLMRIASCESSQLGAPPKWDINTGNGYYGGLQFDLPTWASVGGVGFPHHASAEEQLMRGEMLVNLNGGYRAWPHCGYV